MSAKTIVILCALALTPLAASAQTDTSDTQAPPNQGGPMIVERVHNGFLVSPDVKVTAVDKKASEVVGAYAGWVIDEALLIGGGGYVLANPTHDRQMGYGGLVVQWLARRSEPIGFSLKGLVGAGATETSSTVTEMVRMPYMPGFPQGRIDVDRYVPTTFRVHRNEAFFVAEPEADLLVKLSRRVHLTVGAGYRFTGVDHGHDSGLNGAVGTVGVQIGGGS